jgi:hypothetical protein
VTILVGIVVILAACRHAEPVPGLHVIGTRADSRTQEGNHDGVAVTWRCEVADSITAVGTGHHRFHDIEPGTPGRGAALDELQHELATVLRSIKSIHSSGLMASCGEVGSGFMLYDWHDLDNAFVLVKKFLIENDLHEQVLLFVTPRPYEGLTPP